MKRILAQVEQVAGTEATVLLQGETGTGKDLLAHTIHELSQRKDRPLIALNCAALPPTLIESELFGREKGAYTGAMTQMAGRFEVADRSTLFLDEIGELSLELQTKLLRVLEEGRFERLGSTKSLKVNVRIIVATHRNLAQEVSAGGFRGDLYYRLNVFPILVPPLRDRIRDIPPLVWLFVKRLEKKIGKRIKHIPRRCMEAMQQYPWPGNARELRNIVEHAMITTQSGTLHLRPPQPTSEEGAASDRLEDVERDHILRVLSKTGWRISGESGAAAILGMKRTTLQSKMKKLRIRRPAT
jgi:transcriptional regulator with GAF, ATPase, and Fis domain